MTYTANIFASSIVAVGAFNPAIVTPDWLEHNGLLGSSDAAEARDSPSLLVSHQASMIETHWFALQVLNNQFSLTSKSALSPAFKDLAVGIFTLLPHMPVTAVGLNFMGHFAMRSVDDYHRVGDVFAPKAIWDSIFDSRENNAGLANMSIRVQHAKRNEPKPPPDEIRVQIQPSAKITNGIYLLYNNHIATFSRETDDGVERTLGVAEVIESEWHPTWERAVSVFDRLLAGALDKPEEV